MTLETATYEAPQHVTLDADLMQGMAISFDRVKIPAGGGIAFEVPNGTDTPDTVQALEGVIVDAHPVSTLWLTNGAEGAPHAYSEDGVTQVVTDEARRLVEASGGRLPMPSHVLAECPYNQFGTAQLVNPQANPNGKATKNGFRLYVLPSGEVLPLVVTLPPTSLAPWTDYALKRIQFKGLKLTDVVTRLSLEKIQKNGQKYSRVKFGLVGALDDAAKTAIAAYTHGIKALTRKDARAGAVAAPVAAPQLESPVTQGIQPATQVVDESLAAFDAAFNAAPVTPGAANGEVH